MPDPSPAQIDAIARDAYATAGLFGAWEAATKHTHDLYRTIARAALAAMPVQTPQDAAQQPDATKPTRECPPATTAPQNGVQAITDQQLAEARDVMNAVIVRHQANPDDGIIMIPKTFNAWVRWMDALIDEVRSLHAEVDTRWKDGYAAARHYYADTAPLAVSSARELVAQFRDQWDHAGQLTGTPVGRFLDDLDTILDTAQEPHA